MILTGADGLLKYGDTACVKVRSWQLSVSRDSLDVSCINTYDREFVPGLRSSSGTATLYYDPTQTTDRELLNSIFENKESAYKKVSFCLNSSSRVGNFVADAFITSVSSGVDVGSATVVEVGFQFTGAIEGRF